MKEYKPRKPRTIDYSADIQVENEEDRRIRMNLPSYEGSNPFIFISYSHSDTDKVRNILKRLADEKYRFWYDDSMEQGEDFRNELRSQIERCSALILFMSKACLSSMYCCMEIITAFKNDKRIYPVALEENLEIPPSLKMILQNIQHMKGYVEDPEERERHLNKLIEGLPVSTKRNLTSNNKVITKCNDGNTEITIDPNLIAIGEGAFKDCITLEKISLGPDIEDVRREAFRGCRNLKRMDLGKVVRKVGDSAFRDCVEMKELHVENPNIEIGERAFENCASLQLIELSKQMTEIYAGVFNSCKALESIDLPEELNVMGESCFADCAKLSGIKIPSKVSKIDDMVFNGCLELKDVVLPESLVKIGKSAFKDCKSLVTINIPAKVNSIGAGAFRGCTALECISVDERSRSFKSVDGILFNKNKSILVSYPAMKADRSYTIPDSVTKISDWAFAENKNLVNVVVPDSVQEVGEGAFHMCSELESIVLPDSVTSIDDAAFRGCAKLKLVTIPDSVKDFGWGIFSGCNELRVICSDNSPAASYCNGKGIKHSEG